MRRFTAFATCRASPPSTLNQFVRWRETAMREKPYRLAMVERVSPRVTSSATEVACGLMQTEQGRPRRGMRYLVTTNPRIAVDPELN
jgi:hypothetical protein